MPTEEADWRPGMRPMAWPSNVELSVELELSKSQIKTLVSIAVEEGLLAVESGPSGKRFGRRDATGDIIEAFGFNLAPLAARTPALEAMSETRSNRLREAAALRKQIGQAARIIVTVSRNAASEGLTRVDWNAVFVEAKTIARRAMEPPLSGWPEGLTQALVRLEELSAAALAACAPPAERAAYSSTVPGPRGPDLQPPTLSASPAPSPWPQQQ